MRKPFGKAAILLIVMGLAACAGVGRRPATDAHWEFQTVETGAGKTAHFWRLVGLEAGIEAPEPGTGGCPDGMVHVVGTMKRDDPKRGPVELLQETTCEDWMDPPHQFPRRCARFSREKWENIAATLPEHAIGPFCMDRYEYPNARGANPAIDMNWYEAKAVCEASGKRLCTEDEWTFACEGPEALPYPYGYVRSAQICNIDKPWLDFTKERLSPRSEAAEGLERLWNGEPSGSRPQCVSPFGIYDLAGNVDEWTTSTSSRGFRSILKGGYWSVIRARCRPATRAHNEEHEFYQQGFRCCKS